ncbi:MAG: corrinoid protein [Desulfobacteraceae bacterium]|nr:corrinoid protein [Desulfobacteraceae bacterium]
MSERLEEIKAIVVNGKYKEIEDMAKKTIAEGVDLNKIINDSLIAGMDIVGEKFSKNEIFVPEMLVSARTVKIALEIIKPLLKGDMAEVRGTILMGTVKGDHHDIGKNLVIMILEGAGFNVIDLGVDMSVDMVTEKVEEIKPDILGLSALLTTTMPEMRNVIETLEHKGLRNGIKVMVGGAPIDAKFSEEIGSDGYGEDATEAVRLARGFVQTK